MKVVFAGTPHFASIALQAIFDAGFSVPYVLTQPDRPANRGMQLQVSPVKELALTKGCEVLQPPDLNLDGKHQVEVSKVQKKLQDVFSNQDNKVLVVAAYGLILPDWLLNLPISGCINIHASLLPRWRGAAPIQRAIEAGDTQSGISIMQIERGLDTGDVLMQAPVTITATDTGGSLHDKLAQLGGTICVEALQKIASGIYLPPQKQPLQGITYAHKIKKQHTVVDWKQSAQAIHNKVRAFHPYPGCTTILDHDTLKIWETQVIDYVDSKVEPYRPGESIAIYKDGLVIACGPSEQAPKKHTTLLIKQVQRPGKRKIQTLEFIHGYHQDIKKIRFLSSS
jgi:methionyl-tRNA formyltransferase